MAEVCGQKIPRNDRAAQDEERVPWETDCGGDAAREKTHVGAPQLHVTGGRDVQNNSRRSRRTMKEEDSRGRETLSASSSPMMSPMLTNLRCKMKNFCSSTRGMRRGNVDLLRRLALAECMVGRLRQREVG